MTALSFDRPKLTRSLQQDAKLSPDQAETIADIVFQAQRADLATDADIARTASLLRSEMRAQLAAVRADLTKTLACLFVLQTAIVLGGILLAVSILKP
ncbi:hypothetical protein [Methylobacterium sp. Gmos1]